MEISHLVAVVVAAFGAIAALGKWFINDYVKKIKQIEDLKAKNVARTERKVEKLENALAGVKVSISNHSDKIEMGIQTTNRMGVKMDLYEQKMDAREKSMATQIKEEVGKQLRTEIVKITDQLVMVKSGKS